MWHLLPWNLQIPFCRLSQQTSAAPSSLALLLCSQIVHSVSFNKTDTPHATMRQRRMSEQLPERGALSGLGHTETLSHLSPYENTYIHSEHSYCWGWNVFSKQTLDSIKAVNYLLLRFLFSRSGTFEPWQTWNSYCETHDAQGVYHRGLRAVCTCNSCSDRGFRFILHAARVPTPLRCTMIHDPAHWCLILFS